VDPNAVEELQKMAQKTNTPLFEVGYLTEHKREEAWVKVV